MEKFRLRWRLTEPDARVLPPLHLEQIQPLDDASAKLVFEMSKPWYRRRPFTQDFFADVESAVIYDLDEVGISRRVRKWLYQRGLPFRQRVYLSWTETDAVVTTWKMFVKYWDDLWYPGADDLAVFDESLSWALFLEHHGFADFASRPVGSGQSA
ncbi:MAG: hypothetical protein ABL997_20560 [Planctomycetota bacterium]